MLCFDEVWRNMTERLGELPGADTYSQVLYRTRSILWEIAVQQPNSITEVWECWMNIRLAEEEALFKQRQVQQNQYILPQSKKLQSLSPTKSTPVMTNNNMSISNDISGVFVNVPSMPVLPTSSSKSTKPIAKNDSKTSLDGDDDFVFDPSQRIVINATTPSHHSTSNAALSTSNVSNLFPEHAAVGRRSRSNTLTSNGSTQSNDGTTLAAVKIHENVAHSRECNQDSQLCATEMSEALNQSITRQQEEAEINTKSTKTYMGITTAIHGSSRILTPRHVDLLEAVSQVLFLPVSVCSVN